jgi:hypothetical protein
VSAPVTANADVNVSPDVDVNATDLVDVSDEVDDLL